MCGIISATAPITVTRTSSTFSDKSGKSTLSLTNLHKKNSSDVKPGDWGGHDIGPHRLCWDKDGYVGFGYAVVWVSKGD
jgi:hypothetical protein